MVLSCPRPGARKEISIHTSHCAYHISSSSAPNTKRLQHTLCGTSQTSHWSGILMQPYSPSKFTGADNCVEFNISRDPFADTTSLNSQIHYFPTMYAVKIAKFRPGENNKMPEVHTRLSIRRCQTLLRTLYKSCQSVQLQLLRIASTSALH